MRVRELWLNDFRSYGNAQLVCPAGLSAVRGPNGVGKTNLLEAIGYLASLSSFRGAPADALIRDGADSAVVRAEVEADGRTQLIEAEISRTGRNRVQVNRQRLRRTSDLLGTLRVSVFSPDDLELIKGGPGIRRSMLDDLLVALHPRNDAVRSDWERVLRQRNALLKQVGGRLDESAELTLGVWDAKAAAVGEKLAGLRTELVDRLGPAVQTAYRDLAGAGEQVTLTHRRGWSGSLEEALTGSRRDDLRRGITTVGPHRDELWVELDGMVARTHASQGEQRCLALAIRLAGHREVTGETGTPPVLLLDDVFSELDPERCDALVTSLPIGQAFLSTAAPLPAAVHPEAVIEVSAGELRRAAP